jgi:hypothetical protein
MHDMFSESNKVAARIREIYEALIRSGFEKAEALELTKSILAMGSGR